MSSGDSQALGVAAWRAVRAFGAVIGYGFLAAFVYLVGLQVYRWFQLGEWTHVGIAEGLRTGLTVCCVKDGDSGLLASMVHWIDAPVSWLGLHKALDVLPASLGLFALSILGNSLFIYSCDRIDSRKVP